MGADAGLNTADTPAIARTLTVAAALYTAQGMIGGLSFVGIPTVLRSGGVPVEQIGLISLIMAPWALKALWAPWITPRRTRRILTVGSVLPAGLIGGLAFLPGGNTGLAAAVPLLLAVLALTALLAATVDTACDALLIRTLPERRRQDGSTVQIAGGYAGTALGSGLFTLLSGWTGWAGAVLVIAALLLASGLSARLLPAGDPPSPPPEAQRQGSLWQALTCRNVQAGLLLTLCFEAGGRITLALTGPVLIDSGLSLEQVSLVTGPATLIAALTGTAAGWGLSRQGRACRAMAAILPGQAACFLLLAALMPGGPLAGNSPWAVAATVLGGTAAVSAGFVALYTRLMALSDRQRAATDFALFQSASVTVAILCGSGGAALAGYAGYSRTFLCAALLCLLCLLLVVSVRGLSGSRPS